MQRMLSSGGRELRRDEHTGPPYVSGDGISDERRGAGEDRARRVLSQSVDDAVRLFAAAAPEQPHGIVQADRQAERIHLVRLAQRRHRLFEAPIEGYDIPAQQLMLWG